MKYFGLSIRFSKSEARLYEEAQLRSSEQAHSKSENGRSFTRPYSGGPDGDRTRDLCIANAVL